MYTQPSFSKKLMRGNVFRGGRLGGYTFGFNGKEKVDEVYGDANAYDFGARLYDPRIGRWLAVDPLAQKYANISPYVYAGNSPILFVDYDGKDYGVEIDHKKGTITIVSTIYTTTESLAEAGDAAMGWNNQSGKYQYQVGSGENAKMYSVEFKVKATDEFNGQKITSNAEVSNALYNDNSGTANTYNISSKVETGFTNSQLSLGKGFSVMYIAPGKQEERSTGTHEIGHTLGISHWSKGLMLNGLFRVESDNEITPGMVGEILRNLNIGKPNIDPRDHVETKDAEYSPDINKVTGKITSEIGTRPKDFENGEIKEKK